MMHLSLRTFVRSLSLASALLCLIASSVVAQEGDDKKEAAGESATEKTEAAEATEAPQEEKAAKPEAKQESAQDESAQDDSFEGLLAQFATLNTSMADVQKQFDAATEDEDLRQYRDQYVELVNQANKVVGKIKETGLEKLEAGEKDQTLFETLVGVMLNDAAFNRMDATFTMGEKLIANKITPDYFEKALESPRLSPGTKEIVRELASRCKEATADDLPRVKLTTSKGEIILELFENEAPQTVGNFISLVKSGYYDGLKFHRVLDNFMAQAGCPKGTGSGDPGYKIFCECDKPDYRRHFAGSLSMAKTEAKNTGGSQFFITFVQTSHLDGKHTVFGRVLEGMDIANSLTRVNPQRPTPGVSPDTIVKAEVIRDRGHEYKPTKVGG